MTIRLGVNVDHVATLRNARGGCHPDPVAVAQAAAAAGADGITAHLREDRRHIRDQDLINLKHATSLPLNMEMAAIEEMVEIACARVLPHACCIVPERREELTTEGGLNVCRASDGDFLKSLIGRLKEKNIRVSLFIDPDMDQVAASAEMRADIVELHTGAYCENLDAAELLRLEQAAHHAAQLGLEVHAGHGIDMASLAHIISLPHLAEVNIGHFIIGAAIFDGIPETIKKMKSMLS